MSDVQRSTQPFLLFILTETRTQPFGVRMHRVAAASRVVSGALLLLGSAYDRFHRTESEAAKYGFWKMDPAFLRQRQRDEQKAQAILLQIQQRVSQNENSTIDKVDSELLRLQKEWLQVIFGPDITSIQQRQAFVEEYGCTGWTDDVVQFLLNLNRGLVEIGAGNGQWARCLNQAHREQSTVDIKDFVLAYDDGSALPLPQQRSNVVRPLVANSIAATLRQWCCRHRVLLLVYPPPDDDMAYQAVRAYDEIHASSTQAAVVYVGEGRGGLNANEDFFDYLLQHQWYVHHVLPVRSFGTRGREQLYLLLRRRQ